MFMSGESEKKHPPKISWVTVYCHILQQDSVLADYSRCAVKERHHPGKSNLPKTGRFLADSRCDRNHRQVGCAARFFIDLPMHSPSSLTLIYIIPRVIKSTTLKPGFFSYKPSMAGYVLCPSIRGRSLIYQGIWLPWFWRPFLVSDTPVWGYQK